MKKIKSRAYLLAIVLSLSTYLHTYEEKRYDIFFNSKTTGSIFKNATSSLTSLSHIIMLIHENSILQHDIGYIFTGENGTYRIAYLVSDYSCYKLNWIIFTSAKIAQTILPISCKMDVSRNLQINVKLSKNNKIIVIVWFYCCRKVCNNNFTNNFINYRFIIDKIVFNLYLNAIGIINF